MPGGWPGAAGNWPGTSGAAVSASLSLPGTTARRPAAPSGGLCLGTTGLLRGTAGGEGCGPPISGKTLTLPARPTVTVRCRFPPAARSGGTGECSPRGGCLVRWRSFCRSRHTLWPSSWARPTAPQRRSPGRISPCLLPTASPGYPPQGFVTSTHLPPTALGGLLSLATWATEQLSKSQRLATGTVLAPHLKAISTSETGVGQCLPTVGFTRITLNTDRQGSCCVDQKKGT